MLRRSLFLSLLLVSATCRADDVPAGEPMASAAPREPAPSKPAPGKPTRGQPAKGETAQQKSAPGKTESGDKALSGMSILGNQEAPKSLVIVPWKSSEIGDGVGLTKGLDDAREPVDKEVFMRELSYYEIRSGSK
jgi:hypothetical protein